MEYVDARKLSAEAQRALRERVVRAIEAEGLTQTRAAALFGLSRATVCRWWSGYRRGGADALAGRPRGRRRRPLLAPEQEARLLEVLRHHAPDQVGLAEALWTRDAVAEWAAKALGVRRSRWVWGRWLREHGFTPQRPARRAYQRDPAAVERWLREEYPRVAREAAAEGAEIHWLDEAGVRSDCSVGRGYAPRGRTPVAAVPGRRFGVNYIATVTNLGLMRFLVYSGRLTAAVLVVFLARLLAGRPGKVYVILDSHPTHRGRAVARWVAGQAGRLRLVFLPPYSPELNPAEYLNNDLKTNAQRHGRARDAKALTRNVRRYLCATQYRSWLVKNYFKAEPVRYAA